MGKLCSGSSVRAKRNPPRAIEDSLHQNRPNNIPEKNATVFFPGGSSFPACCFRKPPLKAGNLQHRNYREALLMRSGDIESNPGPPSSPTAHTQPGRRRSGRPTPPARRSPHKLCDSCGGAIYNHHKPLSCNQPNCPEQTHKLCTASSISKYARNPVWTCRVHRGEPPRDNSQPCSAPCDTAKLRCLACNNTLSKPTAGTTHLRCIECGKCCHKKQECCKMTRDEKTARAANWTCWKCQDAKQPVPDQPLPDLEKSFEDVSTSMKKFTKPYLRLLQFNADGLKSRAGELEKRLKDLDIDVALVQETKLAKSDRTPPIVGYKPVREDRKATKGGGLMIYVSDTLVYEIVDRRSTKATEVLTIRIRLSRNKWVTVTNLYCPPVNSTGQEISLELNSIPKSASSIIFGDFNAHHPIWDEVQPEDTRGIDVVEWANDNSLTILSNGSPTRHSRVTAGCSSPDLTICGAAWEDKCQWAVDDEEIGGSDHLPIVVTILTSTSHQPILGRAPRWRSNGVDWKKFREEVELKLSANPPSGSIKQKVNTFNEALISAAKLHVRKVKPCKKKQSWMTPKVRNLIKSRNILRKSIKKKRKEWLAACTDVTIAKREARQEQWKEVVSSAIGDIDERNMWRLIKSLNGSPDLNSPNEAMVINGKRITSTKKKADLFAQHYASVSKLSFTRQERRAYNMKLKRLLSTSKKNDETPYKEFSLSELKAVIAKMRRKGAPGPDDIPPSFLKELGPIALSALLSICNECLRLGECPQLWRNAILIPLLKAAKSPSELASYRPVSLTSCVAKALERMFAERLYFEAESKGWFAPIQAGFRRGHSCADQILRVTQAIEDGFQQPKGMERSVLVLLDYSKAFDTVWRERLLLSMADKGVPIQVIRWLYSFLQNRQARVRLHDQLSSSKTFHQGLPQGCVLSPLLFIFFINNLAELLMSEDPDKAAKLLFSLFADDVTVLATHRSREEAAAAVQWAVNVIHDWSLEWKLNLNASKSEASFFSTWSHESKWEPSLQIGGKDLPFNETPKLLGVYLDTTLSFGKHTKEVAKAATAKVKIISAVANKTWGWKKEELKKLYFAYVRSKLDYAGPAWQPWLSDTNIGVLEATQNKAFRAISGQLKSTPVEALRYEVHLPAYKTHLDRNCLKSFEQAKRLPHFHPRRRALDSAVQPRTQANSWFRRGTELSAFIPENAVPRQPIVFYEFPPYLDFGSTSIMPELDGSSGRRDDPARIRAAAEAVGQRCNDLHRRLGRCRLQKWWFSCSHIHQGRPTQIGNHHEEGGAFHLVL